MIRSFRHKGLQELFEKGRTAKVDAKLQKRVLIRLDALHAAVSLNELAQPGFDFHPLKGKPQRYTLHVNGPVCITFEWEEPSALRVDLENYH
ncbi:type II toxin-antitoxin system RelE/ParE family toxin [Vineibacter terrae]|uniref:type II toxin-antitoxin system RelE/ParE family toxin n=1 Tax=Vineibacter terrae TaxID=2586908 RepID=UPI002E318536|nr:type II toxin-antitoxin system RelE/ParE family toxin [Vineibacter terrae]HEX2886354.1 type II toxin-antitoxin system RelE/ParE family toxin [Vineibacter terrae]